MARGRWPGANDLTCLIPFQISPKGKGHPFLMGRSGSFRERQPANESGIETARKEEAPNPTNMEWGWVPLGPLGGGEHGFRSSNVNRFRKRTRNRWFRTRARVIFHSESFLHGGRNVYSAPSNRKHDIKLRKRTMGERSKGVFLSRGPLGRIPDLPASNRHVEGKKKTRQTRWEIQSGVRSSRERV